MSKTVLIVEDESTLARNIARYLGKKGYETVCVGCAADARTQIDQFNPEFLVLDYRLPDDNGIEVVRDIRKVDRQVKIVMITGAGSVDIAVDAMRAGANDYLSKPIALVELLMRIERLSAESTLRSTLDYYHGRDARYSGLNAILGESEAIKAVKSKVKQLLSAEIRSVDGMMPAVLVRGETGTGKELVARALHFDGLRRSQAFVEVNCASIPEQLLESELFGHERGAFTDAKQARSGLFEAAHGGTLFLDEIGDMHVSLQAKLLRVLEDGKIRRIGASRDRDVNTRIVAATNQDIEAEIDSKTFRADLLYRLGVISIELPPLRDRGDDIILLARSFLGQLSRRYGRQNIELSDQSIGALSTYHWPGNIRELRNVVERAILTSATSVIDVSDLSLPNDHGPTGTNAGSGDDSRFETDLNLVKAEIQLIERALERSHGNITRAAPMLGLGRDALRYKIEKHGIRSRDKKGQNPSQS